MCSQLAPLSNMYQLDHFYLITYFGSLGSKISKIAQLSPKLAVFCTDIFLLELAQKFDRALTKDNLKVHLAWFQRFCKFWVLGVENFERLQKISKMSKKNFDPIFAQNRNFLVEDVEIE